MFKINELILSIMFMLFSFNTQKAHSPLIKRVEVEKSGNVVWDVPSDKKFIALTFDDGPHPIYTPQILDILKKNHVHATFFLIGKRINWYPQIVKRELDDGHEVGNHTYSHPDFTVLPKEKMINEIRAAQRLIDGKLHHHFIKIFRPPAGIVTEDNLKLIKKEGFTVILWSYQQDPKDWSKPGAKKIADHILKHIKSGNIILLHDAGGNRAQTVSALKIIIPQLKKQGFQMVTVDELLKTKLKYQRLQK